jgi:integrase
MSVYQRGSIWYVSFYDANGKRHREPVGKNRKLAEAVDSKRQTEVIEGRFFNKVKITRVGFTDFSAEYLQRHAILHKRSWKSGDAVYIKRLNAHFGNTLLTSITSEDVMNYQVMRSKEVCPASVNRDLACLKTMFNKAIEWEKASENPIKKIKFLPENNARKRYLTEDEMVRLLDNCSNQLKIIVLVAIHTGMRKSELQNLRWQNVDLNSRQILLVKTKSGKDRTIPMNSIVHEAFKVLEAHKTSEYVIAGKDGQPFNFRKAFETALRKSEIQDFVWHDLRHSFGSHLAMAGVAPNTIRELMGHSSLAMTQRYLHLSNDHKMQAVEQLSTRLVTNQSQTAVNTNPKISDRVITHNLPAT